MEELLLAHLMVLCMILCLARLHGKLYIRILDHSFMVSLIWIGLTLVMV